MRVVSIMLALAVSLVLIGRLSADEQQKRPERQRSALPIIDRLMKMERLNLTSDQKAKLEELKKEYGPKVEDARKKLESIPTDEQKKARREAMKAAREAGKRPQEAWKEAQQAMKLTDEQKAKMAAAEKELEVIHKEVRQKAMSLLTEEQKELVKKGLERRKERPPKVD